MISCDTFRSIWSRKYKISLVTYTSVQRGECIVTLALVDRSRLQTTSSVLALYVDLEWRLHIIRLWHLYIELECRLHYQGFKPACESDGTVHDIALESDDRNYAQ